MVNRRNLLKLSALGTASFAAPQAYSASKITMAYNTGNPPGSKHPKDLSDNAEDLDLLMTAEADYQLNRLGAPLKSWKGMVREFDASQVDRDNEFDVSQVRREDVFNQYLEGSGWTSLGIYASGIAIVSHRQTVDYAGQPYALKPSVPASISTPYITTGDWTTEAVNFKLVGDNSLRQDLSGPEGSGFSGHQRGLLNSAIDTVRKALNGQPINVFEFAQFVVSKPDPADASTWDWGPALNAACVAGSHVIISQPIRMASAVTVSGVLTFTNTGVLSVISPGVLTFADNAQVKAPLRKVFDVTPVYAAVTVSNTTTQDIRITNVLGTLRNAVIEPEWFGAVADFILGAATDSYNALNIAQSLGNLRLNSYYLVSQGLLIRNDRLVVGAAGRAGRCGFRVDTSRLAFTGNYIVGNYEVAGLVARSSANGFNQNPYVSLKGFGIDIRGMYRTGTTIGVDAFIPLDMYQWETTFIKQIQIAIRKTELVATPTMYQIARYGSGPCAIENLDFLAVDDSVNVNCLADNAIEFYDMTNMHIRVVNANINCNRAIKATCLKEAPSRLSEINVERHPSHYGGSASTRPSLILQGPLDVSNIKLSAENPDSLAIRILSRRGTPWEARPLLRNIAMFPKPNDVDGYFSGFLEILDAADSSLIEKWDKNRVLGAGSTQTQTSVSGIASYIGGEIRFAGAHANIANHANGFSSFYRKYGAVAIGGSVTVDLPRTIATGPASVIGYKAQVVNANNSGMSCVGSLEGTGASTSSLRNNYVHGNAVWTIAGALSGGVGSLTFTNASGAQLSECTVLVEFFGTPSPN